MADEAIGGRDYYMPFYDAFQEGVTLAEGQRITQVRAGFLEALVEDPRVRQALPVWVARMRAAWTARIQAGEAADPAVAREVSALAITLVRDELRLPWPWVMGALVEVAQRMLLLPTDDLVKALPPMVDANVFVIPYTVNVGEGEGIPIDEAIAAMREIIGQLEDAKAAAIRGDQPGKAPRAQAAPYLRTWGRWYYQRHVKNPPESERVVARAHHVAAGHPGRFEDHDCRRAVQYGVAQAKRLLTLGRYEL